MTYSKSQVDTDIEMLMALESIRTVLNQSKELMSTTDMSIINIAAESVSEVSLNDNTSRVDNTITNSILLKNISAESLSENIKNICNKIIKYIKDAFNWAINRITNFRNTQEVFYKRAVELKEKSLKVSNKTPTIGYIENSSLAKYFSRNNKVLSGKEIINLYRKHRHELSETISINLIKETLVSLTLISNKLSDSYTEQELFLDIDKVYQKLFSGPLRFIEDFKKDTGQNLLIKKYDFEFDNKSVFANCSIQDSLIKNVKIVIETDDNYDGDDKLAVLSTGEIRDIASLIEQDMSRGDLNRYDSVISGINKINNYVNRAIDKIMKEQESGKSNVSFSIYFLKSIVSAFVELLVFLQNYDRRLNKALLGYCDKSLEMYE